MRRKKKKPAQKVQTQVQFGLDKMELLIVLFNNNQSNQTDPSFKEKKKTTFSTSHE